MFTSNNLLVIHTKRVIGSHSLPFKLLGTLSFSKNLSLWYVLLETLPYYSASVKGRLSSSLVLRKLQECWVVKEIGNTYPQATSDETWFFPFFSKVVWLALLLVSCPLKWNVWIHQAKIRLSNTLFWRILPNSEHVWNERHKVFNLQYHRPPVGKQNFLFFCKYCFLEAIRQPLGMAQVWLLNHVKTWNVKTASLFFRQTAVHSTLTWKGCKS